MHDADLSFNMFKGILRPKSLVHMAWPTFGASAVAEKL